MKLTRNNKFKKIRKTRNKRQNKKIRKTRNGKQNKRITKKQNKAQNRKIKGGDLNGIFNYTVNRTANIGVGYMDLYVDRFIARNQDFSSLMNQEFVKKMGVINTFLIYPHITNYAFNDSYNIPFTEPVLFELFDMCKFRIKKFFTIPINFVNKSMANESEVNESNVKSKIKIIYLTSSRFKLLKYFFTELYEILNVENVKIDIDDKNRIQDDIDEKTRELEKYMETANRIDDIEEKKKEEITVTSDDIQIIEDDNTNIDLDDDDDNNNDNDNNNNNDPINRIEENDVNENDIDSKNIVNGLYLYAKDYFKFDEKSRLLSKLNKYIFIEDLIYPNRPHNITPFYTKKETIIYLCRLLINRDIDLYDDDTLKGAISELIIFETDVNYLDNKVVYDYLNFYIKNNDFEKNQAVYFSDILYKTNFNANRIDDENNSNKGNIEEVSKILNLQKDIIEMLLEKIIDEKIDINGVEYSFVDSYKKMVENRKKITRELLDPSKIEPSKIQELATQLFTFKSLIPELATKISHYNCTSPINWISGAFKSLILFHLGPLYISLMTMNCYISAVTFFTVLYIFKVKKQK